MDALRHQLGQLPRRRPTQSSASALEARGALVELPAFLRAACEAGQAVLQAAAADSLEGRAGYEDAADAALAVLLGGGAPNSRPGQLGLLVVQGSHYAGRCLDANCTVAGCPGNTLTFEADGSVSLFFTHHKNEAAWKGAPVAFTVQVSLRRPVSRWQCALAVASVLRAHQRKEGACRRARGSRGRRKQWRGAHFLMAWWAGAGWHARRGCADGGGG